MKTPYKFLCLILIGLIFSCQSDDGGKVDNNIPTIESPEWKVNLGRDTSIPFFPDAKSNYFTYSFQRNVNDQSIIKLHGEFPNARYFSIVIYDNDSRDPINIIRDIEISPTIDSSNPFQEQLYATDQEYEIHIVPNSLNITGFQNSISYDSNITSLSVFIRYYLPEHDDFGNVDLPNISAIDINNEPIQAPAAELLEDLVVFDDVVSSLQSLSGILFYDEPESDRYFFRVNGDNSGNFANPDNAYLINATTLMTDQVILLRWKAPSVSVNFTDFSADDLRFYSISLSDVSSYNYATISDLDLHIASDGFINLVISKQDQEVIDHSNGLNYLNWPEGIGERGYILYRNMLTNNLFQNSIDECPTLSGNFVDFLANPELYDASNHIGVFAPSGKRMSKSEFLDDFGGLNVSY